MARPRKLTPIEEFQIYNRRVIKGESPTEIAFQYKISVRSIDRIIQRIKKEKNKGENLNE